MSFQVVVATGASHHKSPAARAARPAVIATSRANRRRSMRVITATTKRGSEAGTSAVHWLFSCSSIMTFQRGDEFFPPPRHMGFYRAQRQRQGLCRLAVGKFAPQAQEYGGPLFRRQAGGSPGQIQFQVGIGWGNRLDTLRGAGLAPDQSEPAALALAELAPGNAEQPGPERPGRIET